MTIGIYLYNSLQGIKCDYLKFWLLLELYGATWPGATVNTAPIPGTQITLAYRAIQTQTQKWNNSNYSLECHIKHLGPTVLCQELYIVACASCKHNITWRSVTAAGHNTAECKYTALHDYVNRLNLLWQ